MSLPRVSVVIYHPLMVDRFMVMCLTFIAELS